MLLLVYGYYMIYGGVNMSIEINGSIIGDITEDEFLDRFLNLLDDMDCCFVGVTCEEDDEDDE